MAATSNRERNYRGEGTLRKRADGNFEGRISLGIDPITGNRIRKSVYGATRSETRRKMKDAISEYEEMKDLGLDEKPFAKGEMLFADWLKIWLTEYKINNVSPGTYESYRLAIDNHIEPILGDHKLINIKPEQIQLFLNSRIQNGNRLDKDDGGLSSAYTIKMKNIINASLKQAVKNRMIPYNPTDAITPPKLVQKEIRVLTRDEQTKLVSAFSGHRLEALFNLALATGMRKGEIAALTWDCVNFENKTIQIMRSVSRIKDPITHESEIRVGSTKTRSGQRQIPMLPAVIPILKQHEIKQQQEKALAGSVYNSNNLVFCSNVGTYIEPRRINITLDKMVKVAGIEHVNFHALRHTFATRALENGVPAKVVQEILGHANVALTLNTYSHVLGTTAHDQIAKLNSLFKSGAPTSKREKSQAR